MNDRGLIRLLGKVGMKAGAPANTANTTVGAATWTAASVVGGMITRSGSTAAYTDTTPTATAIVDALKIDNGYIGIAWYLQVRNNTAFYQTISGGTGVTVSGLTVNPPYSTIKYLLTYTASGTFTMVALGIQSGVAPGVHEVVTATNIITADENGSVYYLNSATEFVSTLPAPFLGAQFTFIVKAAPSGASYTVVAASAATIIVGHVVSSQDAGGSSDSETSGANAITFVDSKAVIGDRADVVSDGTNWYCRASCKTFDAITIS